MTATFTGSEFGFIVLAVFVAGYLIGYLHSWLDRYGESKALLVNRRTA